MTAVLDETTTTLTVPVYSPQGKQTAEVDLPQNVFGTEPNVGVMHQAYLRQLANARQGTSATKTRGQVSGGGAKPYRQKGTGRARHGSSREPSMVGGGIAFGPQPRSYRQDMPRKMRRLALRSALSTKAQEGRVKVLEGFELETPSTAEMFELLRNVGVEQTVLIVLAASNLVVQRSAGNLPWAKVILWSNINIYDLFTHEEVLIQKGALEPLWETFGAEDGSEYDLDSAIRAVEIADEAEADEDDDESDEEESEESEEDEASTEDDDDETSEASEESQEDEEESEAEPDQDEEDDK